MKLLRSREAAVIIDRFLIETEYVPIAAILGRGQQREKLSAVRQLRNTNCVYYTLLAHTPDV
jgi:hypothetical protein